MTDVLQILTQYCDGYVTNSVQMEDLKNSDFPLWAFKMWQTLKAGLPFFARPENMQQFLFGTPGNEKFTEPSFDSVTYEVPQDISSTVVVPYPTIAGYEHFSARIVTDDGYGDVIYLPIEAEYDSESGSVTIYASAEHPIAKGTVLEFDLYKDGYFDNDLSPEMMAICGLCFAYAWQMKFNNDWLSNVSKIEDPSFKEQNRANKENADTERLRAIKRELDVALKRFEENIEVRTVVSPQRLSQFRFY